MTPPGGERGKALVLELVGRNLPVDPQIMTALPATFTSLVGRSDSRTEEGTQTLRYLVELDADADVGLYPLRVSSPDGLSNILLFSVGALPEEQEDESRLSGAEAHNDSPATSQRLARLPVTINGTLSGPERDVYRFEGHKGDSLVFEVEARRAGSAIDPLIQVLDEGENEIAINDDAPGLDVDSRVDLQLPGDGTFYVVVQDSRFSTQTTNFYRLKIGAFSYAESLYPLGGRRGSRVDVELQGGNLDGPARVTLDLGHFEGHFLSVPVPGSPGALPLIFSVGDLPETVDPDTDQVTPLEPSSVVNGRILRLGEVDRYVLEVEPGESWGIELVAASLGTSRLVGLISVHDPDGKRLASAGDDSPDAGDFRVLPRGLTSSDPYLNFTVPDQVHRVFISVSDLVERGGPSFGYRLLARREMPDFTLELETPFLNIPAGGSARVSVQVSRRGYKGPVHLSATGNLDGLDIHGGDVPPDIRTVSDYVDVGVLTIGAASDAHPHLAELEIWGEGMSENGQVLRRKARGPGLVTNVLTGTGRNAAPTVRDVQQPFTAPWLGRDLPVMVTKQMPLRAVLDGPPQIQLVPGAYRTLRWRIEAREGEAPLPQLVFLEVPGVTDVRIDFLDREGRSKGGILTRPSVREGDVHLITTVGTPLGRFNALVQVNARSGGEVQSLYSHAISVDVVQGYEIEIVSQSMAVGRGEKAGLVGRLTRSEGFDGPVDIRLEKLPPGLTCAPVHVDRQEERFEIPCEALASSSPGAYEVELISSSVLPGYEQENVPYTIPAVQARLTVKGPSSRPGSDPGSED